MLGESWFALAVGVGQPDDAMPATLPRWNRSVHIERRCGVARSFEITTHPVNSANSNARNVLSNDPTGLHFSDDAKELGPKVGGVVASSSGGAEGLAGEPAAHNVCPSCGESQRVNVFVDGHTRPSSSEHFSASIVDLAEVVSPHSSSLKSKAEPSNTAKKI
jgi:hypothetical protein